MYRGSVSLVEIAIGIIANRAVTNPSVYTCRSLYSDCGFNQNQDVNPCKLNWFFKNYYSSIVPEK